MNPGRHLNAPFLIDNADALHSHGLSLTANQTANHKVLFQIHTLKIKSNLSQKSSSLFVALRHDTYHFAFPPFIKCSTELQQEKSKHRETKKTGKLRMVFSLIPSSPHLCFRRKPTTNLILPIRCSSSASSPWVSTQSTSVHFDLKTYWTTLIAEINQKSNEAMTTSRKRMRKSARRFILMSF